MNNTKCHITGGDSCSEIPITVGHDYCPPKESDDPSQSVPWGAAALDTQDMPPLVSPRRVKRAFRTCPFTHVEQRYGRALIHAFIAGAVPTKTGTFLQDFLANQLSRDPASVASQFGTCPCGSIPSLNAMSDALGMDDVSVNMRMQYVPASETSSTADYVTSAKEHTASCFNAFEKQLSQEDTNDTDSACGSAKFPVEVQVRMGTTCAAEAKAEVHMQGGSLGAHCLKPKGTAIAAWDSDASTSSHAALKGHGHDLKSMNQLQGDEVYGADQTQPISKLHPNPQVVSQLGSAAKMEQISCIPTVRGTADPMCSTSVLPTAHEVRKDDSDDDKHKDGARAIPMVSFDDSCGGWILRVDAHGGTQVQGPFHTKAEAYNATQTRSMPYAVPRSHAPQNNSGKQQKLSDLEDTCQSLSTVDPDNGNAQIVADTTPVLQNSHDPTSCAKSPTASVEAGSDGGKACNREAVTEPNRRSSRKKRHPELLDPSFIPRKQRNLQQRHRVVQGQCVAGKELEDEDDAGGDAEEDNDKTEEDKKPNFRGVTHKSKNCWQARISHKGTEYVLGSFKDARAAAQAYDDAARKLRGPETPVNFPDRPQPRPQPKSQGQQRRREKAKAIEPKPYTPPQEVCNVSAIYKGLYLGSANAACDLEWLRCTGIKHVLNVTKEGQVKSHFQNLEGEFEYQRLSVEDVMEAKINTVWDKAFQFLDKVAASDGKVLVHCRAGRSRSVSIVVAWAMKSRGWTLARAWQAVSQARENARPNMGFMMQLMQLERQLHKREDNSHDFFARRKCARKPKYYRDEDYS